MIVLRSNDNSKYRAERLNRVLGFITSRIPEVNNKIISLYDCKGELTVKCRYHISEIDKQCIIDAWASRICGDPGSKVSIEVGSHENK